MFVNAPHYSDAKGGDAYTKHDTMPLSQAKITPSTHLTQKEVSPSMFHYT